MPTRVSLPFAFFCDSANSAIARVISIEMCCLQLYPDGRQSHHDSRLAARPDGNCGRMENKVITIHDWLLGRTEGRERIFLKSLT